MKNDIKKAIHYFNLAANKNIVEANHSLGLIYYDNKDINKAIFYFMRASRFNFAPSQFILGKIYASGQYVERNLIKAIDFFIQSSSNGDVEAHYAVGFFTIKENM